MDFLWTLWEHTLLEVSSCRLEGGREREALAGMGGKEGSSSYSFILWLAFHSHRSCTLCFLSGASPRCFSEGNRDASGGCRVQLRTCWPSLRLRVMRYLPILVPNADTNLLTRHSNVELFPCSRAQVSIASDIFLCSQLSQRFFRAIPVRGDWGS